MASTLLEKDWPLGGSGIASAGLGTLAEDRSALAATLTARLESTPGFSFLRLGDGELKFLLKCQEQIEVRQREPLRVGVDAAVGGPGLTSKDYARLLTSYENCSYADLYPELPYNREQLSNLRWGARGGPAAVVPASGQGIIVDWMTGELKGYMARHRCLFCGAEAALLGELAKEPEYRVIASDYLDFASGPVFLQPLNDGRSLSADLDSLKDQIREAAAANGCDTILLSLGGAAKILCYELAREVGLRAIDVGAPLRSLTYSGSVGYAPARANHHIQFFRVPLRMYVTAARNADSRLSPANLAAKAHAQMALDVQRKQTNVSLPASMNTGGAIATGGEAASAFWESYRYYLTRLMPEFLCDTEARSLVLEFHHWMLRNGIGWPGRVFAGLVRLKKALRRKP